MSLFKRLGCAGTFALLTLPVLLPLMVGTALTPDLPTSGRAVLLGLAVLFAGTWLFLLGLVVPDRLGRRLQTVAGPLSLTGLVVVGLATLSVGVAGLLDGSAADTGGMWGFLLWGVFFLGVAGLLVFRWRQSRKRMRRQVDPMSGEER